MRDLINIVNTLFEGDVVSLSDRKMQNALGDYTSAIGQLIQGESHFFSSGKFSPFAESYISNNFAKEYEPKILLDVNFRDYRPTPEARELLKNLRSQGFKIYRSKWANAPKDKDNKDQQQWGPWSEKNIDFNTARAVFAERDASPYGAYQPSQSGFRTSHKYLWDARGVGFNVIVGGMDGRRGDKYGNNYREEYHIIDDDADMKEVSHMFALIQRAKHIKSVDLITFSAQAEL